MVRCRHMQPWIWSRTAVSWHLRKGQSEYREGVHGMSLHHQSTQLSPMLPYLLRTGSGRRALSQLCDMARSCDHINIHIFFIAKSGLGGAWLVNEDEAQYGMLLRTGENGSRSGFWVMQILYTFSQLSWISHSPSPPEILQSHAFIFLKLRCFSSALIFWRNFWKPLMEMLFLTSISSIEVEENP